MKTKECYLLPKPKGTLCCCGTCFEEPGYGQQAFFRWYLYYQRFRAQMGIDAFLCCNDGSRQLPMDRRIEKRAANLVNTHTLTRDVTVVWQPDRLGRHGPIQENWYPGWWRNVAIAARSALASGFHKLFWIEWDAFVVSASMMEEMKNTYKGLVAYWCPVHSCPESAIFVCTREYMPGLIDVCEHYEKICVKRQHAPPAEFSIPWTDVRRHRNGDRLGEWTKVIPKQADYLCQWGLGYPEPNR